jgi:hypothetical protein
MRPTTGGRWIVGILIIGPMILLQLIHIALIVQAGVSQAQLYRDEFTFAEYWVRSGAAGMLVRALLTLGLFGLCLAMVFGKKDFMASRTGRVVALLAFAGWLCLMLI